jgi:hypothetical protein
MAAAPQATDALLSPGWTPKQANLVPEGQNRASRKPAEAQRHLAETDGACSGERDRLFRQPLLLATDGDILLR